MKKNSTLKEMILGMLLVGVAEQLISLLLVGVRLDVAGGIWSGVLIGIGMSIHMKRSIEDALDLGEEGAVKYIRKTYATRLVIVTIVMGCVIYFRIGHPLALLAGIATLKMSAYMQPYLHKVLENISKGG